MQRAEVRKSFVMVTAGYLLGNIGVNYYNIQQLKFEPFIDSWDFELDYLKIRK